MTIKVKFFAFVFLLVVVLAGCSGKSTDQGGAAKESGSQNVKKMVQDFSAGNVKNKNASITSQQLLVTASNGSETAYNLPKKEFFVSIAPYITQTHP